VDAALDETCGECGRRLLEGADRVDAVGERRVARDAAHGEHVRVGRLEREGDLGREACGAGLEQLGPHLALHAHGVVERRLRRRSVRLPEDSRAVGLREAPRRPPRRRARCGAPAARPTRPVRHRARRRRQRWLRRSTACPSPAAWRCTSRRRTISAARESLPSRISAAVAAASGDFSRNGSMPLPHTYMRPGFAGSLTRMPAASRSGTSVMNSSPNSGTMPAGAAELGEPPVHLLVVEVRDPDGAGALGAGALHDVLGAGERREVRRYVDVGVDDLLSHGSSYRANARRSASAHCC
jgi:hypothetical protein